MIGTLCGFHHVSNKVDIKEFIKGDFISKLPIYSIIYQIKEMFGDENLIILSASPTDEATEEKKKWVAKYVKPILNISEEIYIRYPSVDKVDYLTDLLVERDFLGEDCIFIDDYHPYLRRAENGLGIQCIHPSHLISLYENKQLCDLNEQLNKVKLELKDYKLDKYTYDDILNNTRGMRAHYNILDEYTISQTEFDIRSGKYDSTIAKSMRN